MKAPQALERPSSGSSGYRLSGNAFDAEDLVQDGLLRAFGALAMHRGNLRNPRAYLLRILTNLWIDECRRARPEPVGGAEEERMDPRAGNPEEEARLRDAAESVLALSPREAAAVVMKDAFDLSHAEIAGILSSSEGAVKVALHRGRKRLARTQGEARPARASRELVDRFVTAFRARDMDALKLLLLEDAEAQAFPAGMGVGREHHAREGWLHGCFYHHLPDREANRDPYPMRLEVREWDGEPIVLAFRDHGRGEALEEVWRFEEEGAHVARVRDYCFCPEVVQHVAETYGLPFRRLGYRFTEDWVTAAAELAPSDPA